ncbi:RT0821/Lpp0805 family surface protein [Roseibium sp. MMSF_3544]|uniref:RT0821/Lpp0805 family surface protein n=1 Tax=unclassified Roseibium TaxID=2629323 RepID=UPI00273D4C26|nr:RT0821/Lpp0805 family surface protein [Roseibium sp. MMSF_3544]
MISTQEQNEAVAASLPAALETTDKSMADSNLQIALENKLSGESTRWKSPSSGTSGSVTPLRTWKTTEGTYCRSYSERITLASGKSVNRRGVACRNPNAVWETT